MGSRGFVFIIPVIVIAAFWLMARWEERHFHDPTHKGYFERNGVMLGLIGMLLFSTLGLRSGGFVTAAYLAYVAPVWQDLVFTAACAVATYLLVIAITQPLLLFGRRKLASMIMVGAVVTWSAEYAVTALTQGTYVPWSGLTVMTLMVPALLANDAQRQGWPRTIIAAVLGTVGVFAAMRLLAAGAGWLGLL